MHPSAHRALEIAESLLNPESVVMADSHLPAASLQGLAGSALLHARLSAVDPLFESAAHAHWDADAQRARGHLATHPGIHGAPGGLATSIILGEAYLIDPSRRRHAVRRAVRWLSDHAAGVAASLRESTAAGRSPGWAQYDAISGLAGTGRVLLAALVNGHQEAGPGLTDALTALSDMINNGGRGSQPGWWMDARIHPNGSVVPASGVAETGMAHGIAGPLSFLSTAALSGHTVLGQDKAIQKGAEWLIRWQDAATCSWPPYVTGAELVANRSQPRVGRRDAWCYGVVGVTRALAQAGDALGSTAVRAVAEKAVATFTRRPDTWDVIGPAICHGYAGVLQFLTACPGTSPEVRTVTAAQVSRAAPEGPGYLYGAAGIALALADHAGLPPELPDRVRWDTALLLS
ncbi:lanthionine synthetase LanC family protein [Acrocarpospora sp. B8E8]|uniref:lanthionine synthetase LanC family protein n=1 Tax=Acrocarpospora sp. B8E8 TaxID=3153572 RepID=UPI00325CA9AE